MACLVVIVVDIGLVGLVLVNSVVTMYYTFAYSLLFDDSFLCSLIVLLYCVLFLWGVAGYWFVWVCICLR